MEKNYTYTKLNWLNWIAWNRHVFCQLNCVLMLNWIVLNRTVHLHKNGFSIKLTTNVDINSNKQGQIFREVVSEQP